MSNAILHKSFFRFRERANTLVRSPLRKAYWRAQGASFGRRTLVARLTMTWPHQVSIGDDCTLEEGIDFKFDGVWSPGPSILIGRTVFIGSGCQFNIKKRITIGDDCAIASNCAFIDHDHDHRIAVGVPRDIEPGPEAEIILESEVWLGTGVIILKGVRVGKGAVVGAGAVITKHVPAFEIWGGVPACKIGSRKG